MKSNLIRVSMITVLAAAAACAQSVQSMKADVPFNFIVNGKIMHGGQVIVEKPAPSGALILRTADDAAVAVTQALKAPKGAPGQARLVFHGYGGTYFLAEAWESAEDGRMLPESGRERKLAGKGPAETKTIALAQP